MASPRSRGPRGGLGGSSPPNGRAGGRPPGLALLTTDIRSSSHRGLPGPGPSADGFASNLARPAKPAAPPHRIKDMSMSGRGRPGGQSAGLGAVAGVLAAGTALGVGQFVAGLTGASGSPVVVVGELQIDFTPPWLKNFAITEFGADDKLVLVSGILAALGVFAAIIGAAAATRRMAFGVAGLAVFAVVGLTAAATRPTATVASLLPTLAATASALAVLLALIPLVKPPAIAARPAVSYDPVTGPPATGPEDDG